MGRQHRTLWRHHHVPWYRRQDAEGDHRPGPLHHQDQDHCSPREEVLCLDRRLHPGIPLHLPADVDLQAGVRRVRPIHCPPQVLLSASQFLWEKNNTLDPIATIFIYLSVGLSLLSVQPYFHCLAVWSPDIDQLHSTVYYIPSSTLTLFLQNISPRDFCILINCLLAPFKEIYAFYV